MEDGPCVLCNEQTSCIAGNPSRWPVRLPYLVPTEEQRGKTGFYHVGCVMKQMRRATPTPDVAGLVEEGQRNVTILAERDLGIAEFHAMQLPLSRLIEQFIAAIESLSRERAVLAEGFLAQRRLDSKGDTAILTDADEPDIQAVEAALALIEGKERG